jgi:hypothetical protein
MDASDLNNLGDLMNEAREAMQNFIGAMYKVQSNNYQKVRVVSSDEDLATNEEYFMQIPQEFEERYINALVTGLKAEEAYELLKETYEFENL